MGSKNKKSKTEKVSKILLKESSQEQKKKMGRPRIEIDFELLAELCAIRCTRDDICRILKIDADTLSARIKEKGYAGFSSFYNQHLVHGELTIRRGIFKLVEQGDRLILKDLAEKLGLFTDRNKTSQIPTMRLEILNPCNQGVLEERERPKLEKSVKQEEND